jgi:hypothetical protein
VRFVVREYVDGESLRAALERDGPLEPVRAATIVASVLDALAALHAGGVAHGDLGPTNVVVSGDGSVRVCDAGIAAAATSGRPRDATEDLRAAAALLFELLTGRQPGPETPSMRALRPDVPRDLDAIVHRTLVGEGSEGAADIAAALRTATGEKAPGSPPDRADPDASPTSRPPRSRWFRTWVMVPLLVVVGAASAVALGLTMGRLEFGGPLGIRVQREAPSPAPSAALLPMQAVIVFDPFGDQVENDDAAPLAADGNRATAWRSENYFDGRLNKPGVGLVFDLGSIRTVTGFRLLTPAPGYRFAVAVGDSPSTLPNPLGPTYVAASDMRETVASVTGRYVFLWCTSVVPAGDGNRVVVAEFRVVGT